MGNTDQRGASALAALGLFVVFVSLLLIAFLARGRAPAMPAPLERDSISATNRTLDPSSESAPERRNASIEREASVTGQRAASKPLALLAGFVRRADAREVVGEWTLEFRAQPSAAAPTAAAFEARTFTSTEFRIEGLTPGIYALRARNGRLASRTVLAESLPIEPTADRPRIELVLEPTGLLTGRIVDAAGAGVEAVRVHLYGSLPSHDLVASSDALGWFRFEDLTAGKYGLGVGDEGRPLFAKREIVFEPPTLMLEPIRMPEHFDLAVRVVDGNGNGVVGARVWSQGATGSIFELTTDDSGTASATGLVAGKYRVFAEARGTGMVNGVIKIGTTHTASIELKLAALEPR